MMPLSNVAIVFGSVLRGPRLAQASNFGASGGSTSWFSVLR